MKHKTTLKTKIMKTKPLTMLLFIGILFTACNSNSTPKCTDIQVQRMAIENALEYLTENESKLELMVYLKNDPKAIEQFEKFSKQSKRLGYPNYFNNLESFSKFFTNYDTDSKLETLIDSALNAGIIYLNGIRINGIEKELKKCNCGASINLGDYLEYDISYTAQYTEDDQIYVTTTVENNGEKK